MFDRFFEENPTFASYMGLHDPFDNLLPKGDTSHILENLRILEEHVEKIDIAPLYQLIKQIENSMREIKVSSPIVIE